MQLKFLSKRCSIISLYCINRFFLVIEWQVPMRTTKNNVIIVKKKKKLQVIFKKNLLFLINACHIVKFSMARVGNKSSQPQYFSSELTANTKKLSATFSL